ncbi:hypothetical protein L6452_14020 [Arctium lappa]|uniref:Uncharacterized protein n=1 Tax=Arctium lappa TaxID=4217 RepID=A0ACB9CJR2_ARCLA|nr:hypothetical protein L6452_14020 [Arctium lappa]
MLLHLNLWYLISYILVTLLCLFSLVCRDIMGLFDLKHLLKPIKFLGSISLLQIEQDSLNLLSCRRFVDSRRFWRLFG